MGSREWGSAASCPDRAVGAPPCSREQDPIPTPPAPTVWATGPLPQRGGTCCSWQLTALHQLSAVRRDVRALLTAGAVADEDGGEAVDRAVLVIDELASNALRHGALPAVLELCDQGGTWLVVATDSAPDRVPAPAGERPAGQGGYGLHVVADGALARGTAVEPPVKHVWAQLAKG